MNIFFKLFAMPRITIIKVPREGFMDSWMSGTLGLWFESHLGYIWLLIALAFLFAELGTPGLFFFISFTIGSICASVLAFLGYSFIVQCLVALGITLMAFVTMKSYLKKSRLSDVVQGKSATNTDALVGQTGVVVRAINTQQSGIVKIRGEEWVAAGSNADSFPEGMWVKIVRVEGNKVMVENISNTEETNNG